MSESRKRKLENVASTATNSRIDIFIQGAAGTGKSFLLRKLHKKLIQRLNVNDCVLIMAPTAISAAKVGGETIHTALGIPMNQFKPLETARLQSMQSRYKNVKYIFIDNVSMVGSYLYSLIDLRLREITGVNLPFGDLHCLKFGDLRLLHPLNEQPIYHSPLWKDTKFFELTKNKFYDETFANFLINSAKAQITADDISFIKSKDTRWHNIPRDAMLLYHSNSEVETANDIRMRSINSPRIKCRAIDRFVGIGSENDKRILMGKIKSDIINLKVGVRYMLNTNINERLRHGTLGILRTIEYENDVPKWLLFDKPIERIERIERIIATHNNVRVSRRQFPIVIAEAMTIHKSQGCFFDKIAVGMSFRMNRPLQYAAFSRVKSPDGLFIFDEYDYQPYSTENIDAIERELDRLKLKQVKRLNV